MLLLCIGLDISAKQSIVEEKICLKMTHVIVYVSITDINAKQSIVEERCLFIKFFCSVWLNVFLSVICSFFLYHLIHFWVVWSPPPPQKNVYYSHIHIKFINQD